MLWLAHLIELLDHTATVVLVTVAACQGSTPRAPGAHMIVTPATIDGTVGGGQLEWRAIEHARGLLAAGCDRAQVVRYPLGARLGQCCGGVVQLVFEPLSRAALPHLQQAQAWACAGEPWGRRVDLDAPGAWRVFRLQAELAASDDDALAQARALLADAPAVVLWPGVGGEVLLEACYPAPLEVMLFGAGHVGTALAGLLHTLPLRLRWVDNREPSALLPAVARDALTLSDDPLAELAEASPGTAFVVMTQSHALDFDLVHAILQRRDFVYCGLIGSASKRARFEARLRQRGIALAELARLRCPIGVAGITGKEPEVIALAVAAEILTLRPPAPAAGARAPALSSTDHA